MLLNFNKWAIYLALVTTGTPCIKTLPHNVFLYLQEDKESDEEKSDDESEEDESSEEEEEDETEKKDKVRYTFVYVFVHLLASGA